MRACSTATNTTPLKINSDLCCLLFSLFQRFFPSEWLPVLSALLALGAYSCFSKPTLSDSVFSMFWSCFGWRRNWWLQKKDPFSPSHCWALHFLMLETDQKRGGEANPQSFSIGLLCSHPQDRLSQISSHLRCSSFSTRASRICRVLAEEC